MMRHQNRPKSQPPIKLNEVCSSYKRLQMGAEREAIQEAGNSDANSDNASHWGKLAERLERPRSQFKGSLSNLETLEELESDSITPATSDCSEQVNEESILISSPSSSSSNSLASSTLSLSSSVSSASTVLAASAPPGHAAKSGTKFSCSSRGSSDEDYQMDSSSSSTASSSGVSSQLNCSLEAAPAPGLSAVAGCLADLVNSVASNLDGSEGPTDGSRRPVVLSINAHMVKELEVEFPYEQSDFNDAQIVKMARRNIFNALKRANELAEREPSWCVSLIGGSSVSRPPNGPSISWHQSANQESMSGAGAQSHQPIEVCVSADEIIGCLIEHELVIWLLDRATNQSEPPIEPAAGRAACGDYLLGALERERRLVPRTRSKAKAPVELAGGNLIGVETDDDLHSIDALVWLCSSERDAERVRDQWRQLLADWRPAASGNSSDDAGGAVTSALPFAGQRDDKFPGRRFVGGSSRQQAGRSEHELKCKAGNRPDKPTAAQCDPVSEGGEQSGRLECAQKRMEPPVARQKSLATGAGLKNSRNSIFVHSASRLRNLAQAASSSSSSSSHLRQLTIKSGSVCDISRASNSALGAVAKLRTAESLSELSTGDHRAAARAESSLAVDRNGAGSGASGRTEPPAQVPAVKPRMSILKNKQQESTSDNKIASGANPVTKTPAGGTGQLAAEQADAAVGRRADRKQQAASDRRHSVSSIRLNSASQAAAVGAGARAHKPSKSILKNGSNERRPAGEPLKPAKGSGEPAQAPSTSESESGGDVSASLARASSSSGQINLRRHQRANQEERSSATNEAGGERQQAVEIAQQAEQSGASEKISAQRAGGRSGAGSVSQQRRRSIAYFDRPSDKEQSSDAQADKSRQRKEAKQPDTQLEDEAQFVLSGSLARERAFERLRQRASCYDITRLMSRHDNLQNQLARLRSGDARQRKPAQLKSGHPGGEALDNKSVGAPACQSKRISTINNIERSKRALRGAEEAREDNLQGNIKARAGVVSQLRHSLAHVDWSKQPQADEDKSETNMSSSCKVIEVKSGCVPPTGGIAVLPLAINKSREDLAKIDCETQRDSLTSPSDSSIETDDSEHELESSIGVGEVAKEGQEAERENDGGKREAEEPGASAATKNGGLSKFSLLRQSFNQKTISSMLKFSSRASMRIISAKPSAKSRTEAEGEDERQTGSAPTKPARSVKKVEEVAQAAVKQQKVKEAKIEQQKQEQQIAALDTATLMLYKRHMQRQQQQQRQLMMQQHQEQQQQQFAFQWQQQMLIQQQRHHQQSQQLAYMANHYQVTTAHHNQQLLQAQAHRQFLAPGHALAPAPIAPVAMGAGLASAAMYAGLPQMTHLAPAHHPLMMAQQQQAAPKQSFASSAGTLLRKSIMKSGNKKQQQLAASQEQLHQSSHLIPLAVNHHSSVNIVYANAANHYASSSRHEQQQQQQSTQSKSTRASSLGASMRKTVKSVLVSKKAPGGSTLELNKELARNNEQQPKKQLKSALKQTRGRESIVLNSEGSDGDGSSTTVESSSSTEQENTNQRSQYVKPSILKKTSTIDKSSMLSLASDTSTSSDDINFKRATSTRCSRRIPASAVCKTAKPERSAQQRKNVTFSTKLTSIL